MKNIIVLGGGGHAKVLIDAVRSTNCFGISGILDPGLKVGEQILGVSVLGSDNFLDDHSGNEFVLALGIGSVKVPSVRKNIFDKYKDRGFEFPLIIHRNAYVSGTSIISEGVQVMACAVIQPDAFIGENVIINTSAVIEHDCKISAHSHISPGAVLGGDVEVGECSHIGLGARVLQGVRIGKNVTIGAGAVVVRNVDDGKTVMGVPAR